MLLWMMFVVAIPLAIGFKLEFAALRWVRFVPFVFLPIAFGVGFAERKVRIRHSLPEKRFGLRTTK